MSVKKFTVYEDRWLCGSIPHEGDQSRLYSSMSGKMCCMGFLAEACGVPIDARYNSSFFSNNKIAPYDHLLPETLRPRPTEVSIGFNKTNVDRRGHGDLAEQIYVVNDSRAHTHDKRKEILTELFAKAGIEVEFKLTAEAE